MNSRFHALAATALALALSACGDTTAIQVCPDAGILADTAQKTVLRAGAPADPSGELYTVRLTGAKTDCVLDKDTNETDSSIDITFHASRAPSAAGAHYVVPYYVAGTQGARVLLKKTYEIAIDFAPGAQTVDTAVHLEGIRIVQEPGTYAGAYQITAGLQVTDADRAYNQARSRYVP